MVFESHPIQNLELRLNALRREAILDVCPSTVEYADEGIWELDPAEAVYHVPPTTENVVALELFVRHGD